MAVPLGQVAALLAAMLMNAQVPGINFFRSAWYLPTVLAGVAMAVMWWSVFDAEHGLANSALKPLYWVFGMDPIAWFGKDARPFGVVAFALASVWTFGGTMLIYLAGLTAIPGHLYEAARIDGAGRVGIFRNVTWPLLTPTTFYVVVMTMILSFQVFAPIYLMTGPPVGGPLGTTNVIVYYLFEKGFDAGGNMGYASAVALVLFAVILLLTLLQRRVVEKRVHYA
jgi:multiple sugar transport system permease protein